MKETIHNYLWSLLILGHNLLFIQGLCPITKPQCPVGYELKNGWCHYVGSENACPPEYEKRNGLCYLQEVTDCFMPNMSTTPSSIAATHTATSTSTINDVKEIEQDRCPQDAIFMNEKCHKIICSLGEYYNGRCLQPACPPGLVWFDKRCQKPAYSITILEIDNNIINDKRNHPYAIIQNTTNLLSHDVINDTTTSATSIHQPTSTASAVIATTPTTTTTTTRPILTDSITKISKSFSDNSKMLTLTQTIAKSSLSSTTTSTTTTSRPPAPAPASSTTTTTFQRSHIYNNSMTSNRTKNCCVIVTPRICKIYSMKWVCFNRRQHLCDDHVCVARTVYLKAPEINYKYPLLIMPPNPIFKPCLNTNCTSNDTNAERDITTNTKIDCSGCIHGQRQYCSSYCYHYICPQGACIYMKLEEYCKYYPRQFGCVEQDGCIWNWC